MIFINLISSASAKTDSGGGGVCSKGLSVRDRCVVLISVNSVRGRCKSDVFVLPWCRFCYGAGTFLVDHCVMMFSCGVVLGGGSVCIGGCLLGSAWGSVGLI